MIIDCDVVSGSLSGSFGGSDNLFESTKREPGADPGPPGEVERKSSMLFFVRPTRDTHWPLSTGEQFREVPGTVQVYPLREELDPKIIAIGPLRFLLDEDHEANTSRWFAQVNVPQAQFVALCAAAQNGRIPSQIRLELRRYKDILKGSDTKRVHDQAIAQVGFTVPLAIRGLQPCSSDELHTSQFTASEFHVLRVSCALTRLEHAAARALTNSKWILVALAALLALVISHRVG